MFLDENLLIEFLLEKPHDMTLSHQKNVYWICVLNLNLRLWDQRKPDKNLHIPLTQHLLWIDSKMCTAWKVSKYGVISGPYFPAFGPEITPYLDTFYAVVGLQFVSLQAEQFKSHNSTNLWLNQFSLHIISSPQISQSKSTKTA